MGRVGSAKTGLQDNCRLVPGMYERLVGAVCVSGGYVCDVCLFQWLMLCHSLCSFVDGSSDLFSSISFRTRHNISHPLDRVSKLKYSTARRVSVPKRVTLEISRQDLPENVPFGILIILFVAE